MGRRHAIDGSVALSRLFKEKVPGETTGNPLDDLHQDSVEVLRDCKLEQSLCDATPNEVVQFERLGYFAADSELEGHFHRTVGLRDEWARLQKQK